LKKLAHCEIPLRWHDFKMAKLKHYRNPVYQFLYHPRKIKRKNMKIKNIEKTLCTDSEYRVISTQQSARSSALFPSQALSALKELAPSAN